MSKKETTAETTAAKKEAKPAKVKAVKEPKAPKVKVEKPAKVKAESKADKARAIFNEMTGQPRKDVVAAFQEKIGLSAAASATYFQNIKSSIAKAASTTA
jgi:hypothetical protein